MNIARQTTSLKRGSALAAVLLFGMIPASSYACLPPPPGFTELPPPSLDEQSKSIFSWASDIVEGVIVSTRGTPRFKVLRTLKGRAKPGTILAAAWSFGFPEPMCAGMISPLPGSRGLRGVIAFREEPELKYLSQEQLKSMAAQGLIGGVQ